MDIHEVERDGDFAMTTIGAATAAPKSLLVQILEWSEATLREWQRDALRRLFIRSSPELAPADFQELYLLLKKSHGIPIGVPLLAKPWAREHVPNTAGGGQPVKLNAMRALKHVNRIVAEQELRFATEGMTIVYGGNGAGKSGYSRVLKRACRARDQSEPIHPDATDAGQVGKIPEAQFEIELEGKTKILQWSLNDTPPEELSTIAVFDGECARAYLTTEGDVAYMPFGLDVVAYLANKVLPELDQMLSIELGGIDVDLSILDALRGETRVGAVIEKFGPSTKKEILEELAVVSEAELARLTDLENTLGQEDPATAAKKLRLEMQRFTELAKHIDVSCSAVSAEAIAKLKQLDETQVAAAKAVQIVAEQLRAGDSLLPGTGDEIWRVMFAAARRYSTEVAYVGHRFPHSEPGAVCPLCQQDIVGASDRMKRFDEFLKQDTATAAQRSREAVAAAAQGLQTASLGFRVDAALATEVGSIGGGVLELVQGYEKSVEERRQSVLRGLRTHDWLTISNLGDDPRPALRAHAGELAKKADALSQASDPQKKKILISEHLELKARVALKRDLRKVMMLLTNVKKKSALEGCRKDLKTTGISTKAKSFAEEAVTNALRKSLEREFESLGGVPKIKLAERTNKGQTKYKLQFAGPTEVALEELLSEGEQRAMAIGSFLAELGIAGHKGAIVFDDPVSSLDHQRKCHIAKRLGTEAKSRQVVIFTHDLMFLSLLMDETETAGAKYVAHWLERDGAGNAGRIKLNDTPARSKAYRDTKLARASIAKAEKQSGSDAVNTLRHSAGQLRRTIEEVVQEYLFKDVVARYRENLMITKLKQVSWDNGVADEVNSLFAELSRLVEGHSHSEAYSGGMPQVGELAKLADRVDIVITAAKKARH